MRKLGLTVLTAVLLLGSASVASAQIVYVQSPPPVFYAPRQPIVPSVSYSYYPPSAIAYAPPPVVQSAAYYAPPPTVYAPAPTVAYYPPAVVAAPNYGVYTQTTTYGLGIFRPRGVTTQYYYAPVYPR